MIKIAILLVALLPGVSFAAPAAAEEPAPAVKQPPPVEESFVFGSYGRVSVGSDLRGGSGAQIRMISHPPRLLESPYAELDFGYLHRVHATGSTFHTRLTLALGPELFHQDGHFDSSIAVRNLYVEGQDVLLSGLSLWVGSRMLRGDDIYLMDFWPLDEQNTVGGGVDWSYRDTHVRAHLGLDRLDDPFQTQRIEVPAEELGTREVLFTDRPRLVTSLRGEQQVPLVGELRLKGVLYGETHHIAQGTHLSEDRDEERLPAEFGWLLGTEVGVFGFGPNSHVNVFARYGSGLAAYDELAVPTDLANDDTTDGARELMAGVAANVEDHRFGALLGGYARYFVDADPDIYDNDDRWEVGGALRPAWFVTEHLQLLSEVNVQLLRPNGISSETGQQEIPVVWQLGLMPSVSVGRGSYARPQLRLVYAVSFLNASARQSFAPEDIRRSRSVQHFLGLNVEWWFNSSRG